MRRKKFALIQEISRMLRDAPHPVRRAWREGWTDIKAYPNGYMTNDCNWRLPGWYGHQPATLTFAGFRLDVTQWRFICDPDGRNPYFSPTFVDPMISVIDIIK